MTLTCPYCQRSLSSASADGPPQFCMFCGHRLTDSTRPPTGARTQTFAPGAAEALSGVPDEDDLPEAPAPALTEIGGYRLGKLLGSGGMGSVYEAEAVGTGRRVAVKLLSSRLASSPSSVERFRQEGRLASQLAHPRCVFVLAADTEHGRPYIVMELMPGATLKDVVDRRGPLNPHEAIGRILDVIDGLTEAHRVGVIHRDVKPSNCFLTADDRVKVGDFGLSKSLAASGSNHLTQTGAFLGTVLFASPEQIRGEPLDYSSDVYSVAATLYFLLSGQAPFHHDNAATALAKAIADPPPRICETRPDVPEQLERIILRGLERDRARRWQTLDDMREALADLLPERQRPGRPRALIGAYFLDRILLAFIVFPAEVVRIWATDSTPGKIDVLELRWLAVSMTLLYFALFEGRYGATPGKMLFGLRVSRAGETGPPGVPRAFVRTFVLHAVLACFFLGPNWVSDLIGTRAGGWVRGIMFGLGTLALSVQLRKALGFRGLHDFASGCRVTQTPLRARKMRLPVPQPTPLETLLPAPPLPLPELVGGYIVRGCLSADASGEQVWIAEDRALGRKVLLWLRPWGTTTSGAEPARPTRLRRLGAGSVGLGEAAYDWTAFAAPLGGPLVGAVRPGHPLPWADARVLLEQLVDEFRAAEADGSVPAGLALSHIWVEPTGRVQVLDFPLCAAPARAGAPLSVLREAASLLLEGRARGTSARVAAPLPPHAAPALNKLFTTDPPLAELQKELAETHAHKPEVTPAMRAAHLGVQAPLLAIPLGTLFGLAFVLSVFTTAIAAITVTVADRAATGFTDPAVRARLAAGPDRTAPDPQRAREEQVLDAARAALSDPGARARVERVRARARADEQVRRDNLFTPQRHMLEEGEQALPTRGLPPEASDASARELLAWAVRSDTGEGNEEPGGLGPVLVLFAAVPLGLILSAAVLRGGVSMMLAGMAIVRADGRRARRWQCAVRAAVVWVPLSALLGGCAAAQIYAPHRPYLAAGLWLAAVVLLPVYGVIALRYPTRPPQDRIAGTYLVPV